MTPTARKVSSEPYYDLDDDWSLVVSSFQTQYGIRLSNELSAMSWREFSYLIEGLSGDTPLGRTVAIRAETDPDVIKGFTPYEKRIRNEYRKKQAMKKPSKDVENALEGFKRAFIQMAQ